MSARAHAERFLAACPEDVRAALRRTTIDCEGVNLLWRGEPRYWLSPSVQISFLPFGNVYVRVTGQMRRHTHIDRLLSNYPREVSHDPA